jgi:hypothetical protein
MARVSWLRTAAKSSCLPSARHDAADAPQAGVFAPASFRERPCLPRLSTKIVRSVYFYATQSCAAARGTGAEAAALQRARTPQAGATLSQPRESGCLRPDRFCRRSSRRAGVLSRTVVSLLRVSAPATAPIANASAWCEASGVCSQAELASCSQKHAARRRDPLVSFPPAWPPRLLAIFTCLARFSPRSS